MTPPKVPWLGFLGSAPAGPIHEGAITWGEPAPPLSLGLLETSLRQKMRSRSRLSVYSSAKLMKTVFPLSPHIIAKTSCLIKGVPCLRSLRLTGITSFHTFSEGKEKTPKFKNHSYRTDITFGS